MTEFKLNDYVRVAAGAKTADGKVAAANGLVGKVTRATDELRGGNMSVEFILVDPKYVTPFTPAVVNDEELVEVQDVLLYNVLVANQPVVLESKDSGERIRAVYVGSGRDFYLAGSVTTNYMTSAGWRVLVAKPKRVWPTEPGIYQHPNGGVIRVNPSGTVYRSNGAQVSATEQQELPSGLPFVKLEKPEATKKRIVDMLRARNMIVTALNVEGLEID